MPAVGWRSLRRVGHVCGSQSAAIVAGQPAEKKGLFKMSALWVYVLLIERQIDLLEMSNTYDSVFCCETYPTYYTPAPGVDKRRHWTRMDGRRCRVEREIEELYEQYGQSDDYVERYDAIQRGQ